MKQEFNDKGECVSIHYSPFEVEIASLLFSLLGGSTEPLYKQKARWEYIQSLKRMAQMELEESHEPLHPKKPKPSLPA